MKKFFGSKSFLIWLFWCLGWTVGRWSNGGELDEALIGGLIVGGIVVVIAHFIGQSRWFRKLTRQ